MPIFTRRRLQSMLNDLHKFFDKSKGRDLLARINDKRVGQTLPAEMELVLVWALFQLGEIEVEPAWFSEESLPDVYSEFLFPGVPAIVEITAVSDAGLSGEDDMRRVTHRICEAASAIRNQAGKHLYFQFREENGYNEEGYFRRRKVQKNFVVTDEIKKALSAWLGQPSIPEGDHISITDSQTDVRIGWKNREQHPLFNFFSSMPSEVYSLTKNPVYSALSKKSSQIRSPNFKGIKCIFLADAGSHLLRQLDRRDPTNRCVNGSSIIREFISSPSCNVDVVCVFSPAREQHLRVFGQQGELQWKVTPFVRPGSPVLLDGLKRMAAHLPRPRFEAGQIKSLHQQQMFDHSTKGWYVGTQIESNRDTMTIRISARAVLDLLAGRISPEQFGYFTGMEGAKNLFQLSLNRGDIIKNVALEPRGIDEDDDNLVFTLSYDPSATELRLPKSPQE
jgi:hypothetical protein